MKMKLALVAIMFALLLALIVGFARLPSASAEGAVLSTDKPDYAPSETVTIFGSGFNALANITATIERPDGTIDTVYAVANDVGGFMCTYQLDGITGIYTVTATDGTNTATTTFTDTNYSTTTYLNSISSSLVAGQTFPFSGTVTATPPVPIGASVNLQCSDDGTHWSGTHLLFTAPTSISIYSTGYFSGTFTAPAVAGTYYFRADFPLYHGGGGDNWAASHSDVQTRAVSQGYLLTVATNPSGVDSTTGSGTYASGAVVSISAPSTQDIVPGSSRYSFNVWTSSDGGTFGDASLASTTFTMPAGAVTVTANYVTQYYISVTSDHGSPTASSGWVNDGDPFSVSVTTPDVVVADQHQWVLTGLTVDGTPQALSDTVSYAAVHASHTILFSWTEQWYISVTSDHGSPYTASAWVNAGSDFTASVTSPDYVDATHRWVCTGHSVDGNPAEAGTSHTFTAVDGAHTIVFNWQEQWKQSFGSSGLGADATGDLVTFSVSGGSYSGATSPIVVSGGFIWVDDGATVTYAFVDPVSSSAAGKQYRLDSLSDPASGYTVSDANTLTGNYVVQYLLTVQTSGLSSASYPTNVKLDGSTVGTAYDGSAYTKWFDKDAWTGTIGVDDTVSGDPGVQYVFTKWVEDDSIANPRATVQMTGPQTFTAKYTTRYLLTIATNGLSSSSYPTNVYLDGSPVGSAYDGLAFTKWFDKDDPSGTIGVDATVSGGLGTQFVFTKWDEDSSTDNPRASVTMDGPKTFTADYKTQYQVTFKATGLDADANGLVLKLDTGGDGAYDTDLYRASLVGDGFSFWVDATTQTVKYEYQSPVSSSVAGKQYRWDSTSSSGTTPAVSGSSGTFTVAEAASVTGSYVTQWQVTFKQTGLGSDATGTVVTIDVGNDGFDDYAKDYAGLGATAFSFWVDSGTDIKYTYTNPVTSSTPNTQYWLQSITGPASVVTVTSKTDITGNYVKLPYSAVTTSSLCPFDTDKNPANGQQFNLLFTRDIVDLTKYKLTASNPGQFYYNAFYIGTPGETVTIDLIIPSPFVTQGAVPIHVYSKVDVSSSGCFTPIDEILSVAKDQGTGGTITFSVEVPDTGLVYVTVHLDFGWKKQTGYTVGTNNLADNTNNAYDIPNDFPYLFSYKVGGVLQPDSPEIRNINIFKNDPGFYGVVTVNGEPIAGATITIRDSAGRIIGTATTDENGYYFYYYKYTGKEAKFTVTLTSTATGTRSQTVTLKSNKFVWVPFEL